MSAGESCDLRPGIRGFRAAAPARSQGLGGNQAAPAVRSPEPRGSTQIFLQGVQLEKAQSLSLSRGRGAGVCWDPFPRCQLGWLRRAVWQMPLLASRFGPRLLQKRDMCTGKGPWVNAVLTVEGGVMTGGALQQGTPPLCGSVPAALGWWRLTDPERPRFAAADLSARACMCVSPDSILPVLQC